MNTQRSVRRTAGLAGLLLPGLLRAHEPELMEKTLITGRADSLLHIAAAASEGYIGQDHLEYRPLLRPGEVLETIPGVIVTQHSGSGKANQYFARGFNLDHGTDFATSVDGIPVNLPTHAHGQGYTDLNFLIPELVQTVHYRKGPYYADVGDFGSAGAADLSSADKLDRSLLELTGGTFGYGRSLFATSPKAGGATCSMPSNSRMTTARGCIPRTIRRSTACSATARRRTAHVSASRRWPTRGNGTRPTRSPNARCPRLPVPVSAPSTRPTAAIRTASA